MTIFKKSAVALTFLTGLAQAQTWEQQALTTEPRMRSFASARVGGFPLPGGGAVPSAIMTFGGDEVTAITNTTRVFDGFSWTVLTPFLSPSARTGAAMAVDTNRFGTIQPFMRPFPVLFGGRDTLNALQNDVNVWDELANLWLPLPSLPTPPPARELHAMSFDPIAGRIVVFGGSGTSSTLGDTWTYDTVTGNWLQLTTNAPPPARTRSALEFVPSVGGSILFGGQGASGAILGDLWLLTIAGTTGTWTQLNSPALSPLPLPRRDHAMKFDVNTNRLIVTGGNDGVSDLDAEATWDGIITGGQTTWVFNPFSSTPGLHAKHHLEIDPTGRLVLLGGEQNSFHRPDIFSIPLISVLGVPTPAVEDPSAPGCATGFAVPRASTDTKAALGMNFIIDLSGFPLPTPAAVVSNGFIGTTQSCSIPSFGHFTFMSSLVPLSVGAGAAKVVIPKQASLAGVQFFTQAAALDPAGNVMLSNQFVATIGN